jgi:hypothetical protein
MEDDGAEAVARLLVQSAKADREQSTGVHLLLGATLIVAGFVTYSYGLPGALFTVGGALLISGAIEAVRLWRST